MKLIDLESLKELETCCAQLSIDILEKMLDASLVDVTSPTRICERGIICAYLAQARSLQAIVAV